MSGRTFQRARTAQQQEQRSHDILDAARTMLDEMPLAAISLRELSRRVGLATSNVVRYFPSREAVFLAVLVDDWRHWLDDLERRMHDGPNPCTSTHVASTLAESLAEHRRLCELVAASPGILEHNIPTATARTFKVAALELLDRTARIVRTALPEIAEPDAHRFAGLTWALLVGAWPMAHPSPAVATVLAEDEFAALRIDFVPDVARTLTTYLDGLAAGLPSHAASHA